MIALFFNTKLDRDFYVPPKEYIPGRNISWKLKKARCGIIEAPKAWQTHLAAVMDQLGAYRLKPYAIVYFVGKCICVAVVYVDDLMALGVQLQKVFDFWSKKGFYFYF